jgi:hypothetical protein
VFNVWGKIKELINRPYIVESGSNENGYYIKWSNGDLICRRSTTNDSYKNTNSSSTTVQNLKIYRSNVFTWTYPIKFASVPNISVTVSTGLNGSRFCLGRINGAPSASTAQVQLLALEDFIENGVGYTNLIKTDLIAIGKWK